MLRIFKLRSVALIATIALMGGTAFVASGATGAYFSDTNTGTVTGTFGSIELTTSGGIGTDGLDFDITNLLPGVTQSVTIGFENSGDSAQDVYLALGTAGAAALNEFVSPSSPTPLVWGSVKITRGDGTVLWNSANPAWGPFPASGNRLIRDNVASGASGTFTIEVTIDAGVDDGATLGGATSPAVSYSVVATQVGVPVGA